MKSIRIILTVLFLCVSKVAIPQATAIARSVGKNSSKTVTKKAAREATEAIAKHEAKSIALTATEKSILSRSVRREAQRELAKKSSQIGAKSITEYTTMSISRQFHPTSKSSTLIKRLSNKDRLSQYGIKSVKNHSTQKGITQETRQILQTRLSKYDKVITSNATSLKEKQKALLSINKELTSLPEDEARQLRKCLSPKTQKALSGVKIPRTNGVWENPEKAGNCKWIPDKNFRPKPKTMSNGAIYNNPNNLSWEEILKPYGTDGINYVNCIPDLSPFSYASVQLDYAKILRGKEHLPNHKIREIIQEEAYKQMHNDKQLIARIKKEVYICKRV